jgi:electron-transferring-flavoprotein dehydrogenase
VGWWLPYHQANNQVALGFVTALDYANPYVYPFEEFQRWKQHPDIRAILEGGRRVSYGARAINEGGWQSVPRLSFPGGALIGCSAGFVNVPRIKGSHTAMKSGMLAADAIVAAIAAGRELDDMTEYDDAVRSSWIAEELKLVQNAQPMVSKFGGTWGTILAGADMWARVLKINPIKGMKHHTDAEATQRADIFKPIVYPKPDGVISFDRLTSVSFSNTNHAEDQPCHLVLKDPTVPTRINLPLYAGPEARFCPAGSMNSWAWMRASRACRSTRRTASTARPATSRTHAEHRLGDARRRRRPQLSQHVRVTEIRLRIDLRALLSFALSPTSSGEPVRGKGPVPRGF